jgi:uncharacterized protein (DUF2141 family)
LTNLLRPYYKVVCAINVVFLTIINTSFMYNMPTAKYNLKVVISNMRNDNGQVGICLFNKADGFPYSESAIECEYVKSKKNYTEYTFTDLEMGTYAVSIFHDANDNKKLDKNWLGIPKEGIGTSNNAKGTFGPPKFNDAKFVLNKADQIITISLSYF